MSETRVPGVAAVRAVIMDGGRALHGDGGAFNKGAVRLLAEYNAILQQRGEEKGINYHLVLVVEDTKRTKDPEKTPTKKLPAVKPRGGHVASMPEPGLPAPAVRPPVDPPRKPNRLDPAGKVRVLWERGVWPSPTCIWHDGCQKIHSAPMKIVEERDDSVLLECCACGKRGVWPISGPGAMKLCDEEAECSS